MSMLPTAEKFSSAQTNNALLIQSVKIKVLGEISVFTSNATSCQSLGLVEMTAC